MAFIVLCLEGKALDLWKANKNKYETWQAARDSLALYYGDHYKPDRSYQELLALKQTGTVQDYLTEVDRLNSYARIPDHQLINIMIFNLSITLRMAMAHYENLRDTTPQWRQKLIEMDIINKEFQTSNRPPLQPQHNQIMQQGKKGSFKDRIHLREGAERSGDKDKEWIPAEQKDNRRKNGRCVRCGMSNHKIEACPKQWRKTPPFRKSTTTTQPPTKKAHMDQGHSRITEIGSEEDEQLGKE